MKIADDLLIGQITYETMEKVIVTLENANGVAALHLDGIPDAKIDILLKRYRQVRDDAELGREYRALQGVGH